MNLMLLQIRYTNGYKAHKKIFNIINLREVQIKITMRYHSIFIRMAIQRKMKGKCW